MGTQHRHIRGPGLLRHAALPAEHNNGPHRHNDWTVEASGGHELRRSGSDGVGDKLPSCEQTDSNDAEPTTEGGRNDRGARRTTTARTGRRRQGGEGAGQSPRRTRTAHSCAQSELRARPSWASEGSCSARALRRFSEEDWRMPPNGISQYASYGSISREHTTQ